MTKTKSARTPLNISTATQAAPLVPWVGGKRRLAQHILPLFPQHDCYVEAFCGAAALFFLKEPAKVEVLNDVHGDLVRLYRVVQNHLEEFVRQFKWSLASREMYGWLQDTPPETLTDIQRAARFFYLQKLGFGGKVDGQTFGVATTAKSRLNLLRLEEDLSLAHLRLHQVTIEHMDWAACVERYDRPHTLFYLDPPYYGTEGYGVGFELEQYDRMAELLRTMKGKALVSVNDIPQMRLAFNGLAMQRLSINYTVGASGRGREPKGELLIANFDI
ncbi:Modification methylase DpnIIA [Curvibacter sp. AEP1-3]|uniref:DNA adenine methylase n=1 Tax=Curvibacter sp. AEP1-3 TaxID=1844971 RepID=UPI000B3D0EF9|nr:DNA adenine methylase [Curvibacter sp. AEP1-3]ARV17419.1 Modification methylase DpnIIA [Curvibacter sp. AEP1-3]